MKKIFILTAVALLNTASFAQTWNADKNHSHITFTVVHLGVSDVEGVFKDFEASIIASKPDFSDAKVIFTALTNSVSTDNDYRDKDLKSDHFFDVANFPKLTFESTSIKTVGKNSFKITGNLTLHGVTKPAVFELVYRGTVTNPMSKAPDAGFTVIGTIKRSDFDFGSKFGPPMISDEVTFKASGEFAKAN